MSYPAYPGYKNTEVKWLGNVPSHWDIFSLKRTVDSCTNGVWGDEPNGSSDVVVVRVADFDRETLRVGTEKLTLRSVPERDKRIRLVRSGDLLIEKSGGGDKTLVGCVVLFDLSFDAVTSNFVGRMRPLPKFDANFLCYAFNSLYQQRVNYPAIKQTTGIQNLDAEAYLQERFCFPPKNEQTKIARFLDHQTARIDALIAEQQRLIELLKEKRQAVISHAVTKGLDPDAAMKDSGVEWLGEVPEHWEIKKLKHLTLKFEQGWSPQCENSPVQDNSEAGVLKVGCVNNGRFRRDENKRLPSELSLDPEITVKAGDLLISRANTRDLVGSAATPTVDHPNLMISDKLFRLTLDQTSAIPFFLASFLNTPFARRKIETEATGTSSSMLNIGQSTIREMHVPCPPIEEQIAIRDEVVKRTWELMALTERALGLVDLLQERRSALISAAVTGKIDVRDWEPPASETFSEASVREGAIA